MNVDLVTGPPVPETFVEGWAVHPMRGGMVAHWYRRTRADIPGAPEFMGDAISRCGHIRAYETRAALGCIQAQLLEPGNLPKCFQCGRMLGGRR